MTHASDPTPPGDRPLYRWERAGLALLLVGVAAFGGLVVTRSAFQQSRKTDFGVYARAGYAVREGLDLYQIADDNSWHYCYPPPFAVLMVPLADPLPWADHRGYLPFWVSVVIWYVVNAALVWRAVSVFAAVALPDAAPRSRRWWYARLVPLYVCVGGIGFTLARGQVNLLLVWLFAELFAAALRGRAFTAGLWLAAAVCLKVVPAYLSLFHLVRGEWKAGVGLLAGSAVLLGAVPAAVWGPAGAVELNRTMVQVVVAPGTVGAGDQTRAKELTDATATDSQSFQAVAHNCLHPVKATRPAAYDRRAKLIHLLASGLMTSATAAAGWFARDRSPTARLVFLGCVSAGMLLVSPVSHMHYYAFGLPLASGLWLHVLARRPGAAVAGGPVVWAVIAWGVLTALPLLPGTPFEQFRQFGLGTLATVALWAVGVRQLLGGERPDRLTPAARHRAE